VHLLFIIFHRDIFNRNQLYQVLLEMVVDLLVEVQHLKIIHHVVQHLKKIVLVAMVARVKKDPKMIDIKKDTGIE
jgi:hypothetical protein